MTLTDLEWLRKLIEDEPRMEVETAAASGTERDFFVANPPIVTGSVAVAVNGLTLAETEFSVVDNRIIRLVTVPALDAQVTIEYSHQTFSDRELEHYLTQAKLEFADQRYYVYRAAMYAIDTLMVGLATALDFGAGAETFNMSSVHARLSQMRASYAQHLTEGDDRPAFQLIDSQLTSWHDDYERDRDFYRSW